MNLLEQLRKITTVVSDTGDIDSIKEYKPTDSTTNPSLILTAVQENKYTNLLEEAIGFAKRNAKDKQQQLSKALDKLIINFGLEILKIIPGRVSTEVDARLSFDIEGSVNKARELVKLYNDAGIDNKRVLIKLASTWEGVKAAEILTKENIHCNMTLLFSLPQAIASADVGVQLISPFVGRILDWYKGHNENKEISPADEPGVKLVKDIFSYYRKFDFKTEIMGASFRNIGEILELAGCDLLTISPKLMGELEQKEGTLERKLDIKNVKASSIEKMNLDEKQFRWMLNEDAMATDKLAEGIRKFGKDIIKLEELISKKL